MIKDLYIKAVSDCVLPVGSTLMKTGQTASVYTGDDATYQAGRDDSWLVLPFNNPFGNTNRFTKLDGTLNTWGIVEWMIDWSTFNGTTVLGYVNYFSSLGTFNIEDGIDFCESYTLSGFSGCRMTNIKEGQNLMWFGGQPLSYHPFLAGFGPDFWVSTYLTLSSDYFYHCNMDGRILYDIKTALKNVVPCRTFTVTGTTLT